LTIVVLGGRTTVWGPIIGAAIMAVLPEIARPLEENRELVSGLILILVITFLPKGVGDALVDWLRHRGRAANPAAPAPERADVVASD
jgi:branched-chain amino acid transport system permease protein